MNAKRALPIAVLGVAFLLWVYFMGSEIKLLDREDACSVGGHHNLLFCGDFARKFRLFAQLHRASSSTANGISVALPNSIAICSMSLGLDRPKRSFAPARRGSARWRTTSQPCSTVNAWWPTPRNRALLSTTA